MWNTNTIDVGFQRSRGIARQFGVKRRNAIGGIHFRRVAKWTKGARPALSGRSKKEVSVLMSNFRFDYNDIHEEVGDLKKFKFRSPE